MVTGRGRLVSRCGSGVAGVYNYEPARRPGLYEGWFSGRIARIEPRAMLEEMKLICAGGFTLQLTITTFSEKIVTFTAPLEDAGGVVPLLVDIISRIA
ncbi:hypothetical protein [Bosea lathyri]|uniref:hypothetical protein n=1 Tax=Bosea lathyri TaxID=1036778 RepID=UPI0011B02059|nr:hypothetical protein [Bosea lathyri]